MHYSGSEDEPVLDLEDFYIGRSLRCMELSLFAYETYRRERRAEKRRKRKRLSVESISSERFRLLFRFRKEDIHLLQNALRIPEEVVLSTGSRASGTVVLCIMLRRLSYPSRLKDLAYLFGRHESDISLFFKWAITHIETTFRHILHFDSVRLTPECLARYAAAVHAKGAPLTRCWGFIDGTVRPICRPSQEQHLAYNGHKRVHALKFQAVMAPDGIIAHLAGPFEGRRHDARMLLESGLMETLEAHAKDANGEPFYLYGDPAYPISPFLMTPYRGNQLDDEGARFNKSMSAVRQSVEWGFGRVVSLFAFVDFKKNLKIGLQPAGSYYAVAVLLTNCYTCLYGSQVAFYFGIEPPALAAYLSVRQTE
jgi:hypothetical protein